MKHYVISLCHTQKKDTYMTLWRPDNKGYCLSKEMAGVYEDPKTGYHDSETNMSITEEQADKLFLEVNYEGELKHMIPNCKAVWDILNAKWGKYGLTRKYNP